MSATPPVDSAPAATVPATAVFPAMPTNSPAAVYDSACDWRHGRRAFGATGCHGVDCETSRSPPVDPETDAVIPTKPVPIPALTAAVYPLLAAVYRGHRPVTGNPAAC